jgi:hypothetical protein
MAKVLQFRNPRNQVCSAVAGMEYGQKEMNWEL